jgi:hypothetical protein
VEFFFRGIKKLKMDIELKYLSINYFKKKPLKDTYKEKIVSVKKKKKQFVTKLTGRVVFKAQFSISNLPTTML